MGRKNDHKVGIRLLTDIQLENVLPTYENLFHKINVCREVAYKELQENMKSSRKRYYQDNFMYDNVFSILGPRGTGKTSVAFSLQRKIREMYEKDEYDVVLPLIIPEVIPENCTVLGWILAIIREEIGNLEEHIHRLEQKDREEGYWNKCKYLPDENMKESLHGKLERMTQFFYAGNYNPGVESSYYTVINNSVLQAEDYYKFAKEIADLWDEWIKNILRYQELREGKKKSICPMIYFIFDDVDLAPEKIEEILSVIIKYLSHPNIIVITTADEELFLEVIENALDRNIGRLPSEWRNYLVKNNKPRYIWGIPRENEEEDNEPDKSAEDVVSRTARMYLGKVLPTSTRYYLRLFNTARQKETFCLEDNKNLGCGVKEEVQSLIDCVVGEKPHNFMGENSELINFYLKFMGNTSRQIGNVYIALQELVYSLKKAIATADKKDPVMKIYYHCRYFLRITISANHDLSQAIEDIDEFVDNIFLLEYNQWKLYLHYEFLNEFLKKNRGHEREKGKHKKIETGLQLYSLMAFLENLLLIMEKGIDRGVTGREKIHVVLPLTKYIGDEAFGNRYVFRDDLHADEYFRHYSNLLDRLGTIITDKASDAQFNMEYFYNFKEYSYGKAPVRSDLLTIYRKNPKWFSEIAGRLFLVYGNVYLFNRQNMEDCIVYPFGEYLTQYQRRIDNEIKNNLSDCFSEVKMQDKWEKIKEDHQKGIDIDSKNIRGADDKFYNFVNEIVIAFDRKNESNVSKKVKANGNQGTASVRYLGLVQIIDIVAKRTQVYLQDFGKLKEFFGICPGEIIRDVQERMYENYEETAGLLREYINKVKQAAYSFGNHALLRDPQYVIEVLNEIADDYPLNYAQINRLRIQVSNLRSTGATREIQINKGLYMELVRNLNNIYRQRGTADSAVYRDVTLKNRVEEVIGGMDIRIDLQNSDEVRKAVKLGMQVRFITLLQKVYIFQVISDRYRNGNSISSKDLEKVKINGKKTATYYYQFFNLAVDILEEKKLSGTDNELAMLQDDIKSSYEMERINYINSLIEGEDDE